MEQRIEQQPRQRGRQSQQGQQTMQARQKQVDEVRQWERDWREGITGQVRDIADNTTKMGLVVREMQGDVKDLMEWKAIQDKRRDYHDDKRPDDRRANIAIIISAIACGLSLFGSCIYVIAYIASHWRP